MMQTQQTVPQAPGNAADAGIRRKHAEHAVESAQHVAAD